MSKKSFECDNCGAEYDIVYEPDDSIDEPLHCPFCGTFCETDPDEDIEGFDFWDDE